MGENIRRKNEKLLVDKKLRFDELLKFQLIFCISFGNRLKIFKIRLCCLSLLVLFMISAMNHEEFLTEHIGIDSEI